MPSIIASVDRVAKVAYQSNIGKVCYPLNQSNIIIARTDRVLKEAAPAPLATAFTSKQQFVTHLNPTDVKRIKLLTVRLEVSVDADTRLLPTPYWFERIELWVRGGQRLCTMYPEQLACPFYMMDPINRKQWEEDANFHYVEQSDGCELIPHTKVLPAATNRYFYLPLWGIFKDQFMNLSRLRNDLEWRFYYEDDICLSGGVTITSQSFAWSAIEDDTVGIDIAYERYKNCVQKTNFVEPIRIIWSGDKTLTAGAVQTFELQQAFGISPFICFHVLDTTNPAGIQRMQYEPLGRDTTFDFVSPTNKSILGNGHRVRERELKTWFSHQNKCVPPKGIYYIPFCHSIRESLEGKVDGTWMFTGKQYKVRIDFQATAAVGQQTTFVYANAPATAGSFQLGFNGEFTTQNDHTTVAGTITNQLNALLSVQKAGLTANCLINDANMLTIEWGSNDGDVRTAHCDLAWVGDLNNAGVAVAPAPGHQVGATGWTTSANKQVICDVYVFRELAIYPDGRVEMNEMSA